MKLGRCSNHFILFALACVSIACQATEISHPTSENRVREEVLVDRIPALVRARSPLAAEAARLRSFARVGSIQLDAGANGDSGVERVNDLAIAPDGAIVVAAAGPRPFGIIHDGRWMPIDLPGEAATASRSAGRRELRHVVLGSGRLLTMARSGELRLYSDQPAGYHFLAQLDVGTRADDACALEGDLYVRAPMAAAVVRKFSADGAQLGDFGAIYQTQSQEARAFLSRGLITCNSRTKTIVGMFHAFPEIYGYSHDGRIRWISRFEAFRRPRLVEVVHRTHSTLSHGQREFAERASRLLEYHDDLIIVQLMGVSPNTKVKSHEVYSYVLNASTGQGEFITSELPLLRAATRDRLWAEFRDGGIRLDEYRAFQTVRKTH